MTDPKTERLLQEAYARKEHWHRIRQCATTAAEKRRASACEKAAKGDLLSLVGRWVA